MLQKTITIIIMLFSTSLYAKEAAKKGDITGKAYLGSVKTLFSDSNENISLGLSAEGLVSLKHCLDVALFFQNKDYLVRSTGQSQSIRRAEVQMGYRFRFNDKITTGLSLGTAYSLGDSNRSDVVSEDSSVSKTAEYTAVFSTELSLYNFSEHTLGLRASYSYPLQKVSDEIADSIALHLLVLFPVR